jgi:hypothetical protein
MMKQPVIFLSGLLLASLVFAESPSPAPVTRNAEARDSEIQKGYSSFDESNVRLEDFVKAAEEKNRRNPSDAFLFGVYYRAWQETRNSLEPRDPHSSAPKDLEKIGALTEDLKNYRKKARILREKIGLGPLDGWQFAPH